MRGRPVGIRLAPEGIDSFFDHFRTVQAEEAWAALGGWVEATRPRFGPGIGRALRRGEGDRSGSRWRPGAPSGGVMQARVRPLLAGGAVLVYPTSPCAAPLLTASRRSRSRCGRRRSG